MRRATGCGVAQTTRVAVRSKFYFSNLIMSPSADLTSSIVMGPFRRDLLQLNWTSWSIFAPLPFFSESAASIVIVTELSISEDGSLFSEGILLCSGVRIVSSPSWS